MRRALIIAARNSEGFFELIGIFVLVGISIVGGLLQKRLARKEQERLASHREGKPEAEDARPVQPRAAQPPPWLVPEPTEPPSRTVRPAIQAAPSHPQRQATPPAQPRQQIRRPAKEQTPQTTQTLAMSQPVRRLEQPGRLPVDLRNTSQARKAIIYLEIFSPPKALRTAAQMWEI